jgi:hypothetical protein
MTPSPNEGDPGALDSVWAVQSSFAAARTGSPASLTEGGAARRGELQRLRRIWRGCRR